DWKRPHPNHASFEENSGENAEYYDIASQLNHWLNQEVVESMDIETHQNPKSLSPLPYENMSLERDFIPNHRQYHVLADEYDLWDAFTTQQMYSCFTTKDNEPTRI